MNPLDASSIIAATGLIGIFVVLVAETGLLVGFFLPGDSLLFTAGLLAARQGPARLPLGPLLAVAAAGRADRRAARVCDRQTAAAPDCWPGRPGRRCTRGGPVEGGDRPVRPGEGDRAGQVHPDRPDRDEPDGRGARRYRRGRSPSPRSSAGWSGPTGIILAGYWLGGRIPGIDTYLLPIIAVIIAVSLIPVALEVRTARRTGRAARPSAAPQVTAIDRAGRSTDEPVLPGGRSSSVPCRGSPNCSRCPAWVTR